MQAKIGREKEKGGGMEGVGLEEEPEVAVRSINTASFEWVFSIKELNSFTMWGNSTQRISHSF